jgi:hypothetical protein
MVCTGLIGCQDTNWAKPKDTTKITKAPTPGLPGLQTMPSGNNGAVTKTGQPNNTFTGAGSNLQQSGGIAGSNFSQGPTRTGINTNNSSVQPIGYNGGPNMPQQPGIGAPALPGVVPASVNPPGTYNPNFNPPVPQLGEPVPPAPPVGIGPSAPSEFGPLVPTPPGAAQYPPYQPKP